MNEFFGLRAVKKIFILPNFSRLIKIIFHLLQMWARMIKLVTIIKFQTAWKI